VPAFAHAQQAGTPPAGKAHAQPAWAFNASLSGNFLPSGQKDYWNPVVTADHKTVHLEARYNYESLDTGSVWVGWNFHVGHKLSLDLTPMVGGVFGDLDGFAPGYEATVSYGKLTFTSTAEYVFDAADGEQDFFYHSEQLYVSPWDWLQVGLVAQRTQAYDSSRNTQRGFLVGFTRKNVNLSVSVYNPDADDTITVLELSVSF
jgi:hypothetical protein